LNQKLASLRSERAISMWVVDDVGWVFHGEQKLNADLSYFLVVGAVVI